MSDLPIHYRWVSGTIYDLGEPAVDYRWKNQLSLRNNWLKFKIAWKLPTILEEFIKEYTPI